MGAFYSSSAGRYYQSSFRECSPEALANVPQAGGEHPKLGTVAVSVHSVCVACANTSTLLVLMLRPHLQAGYRQTSLAIVHTEAG